MKALITTVPFGIKNNLPLEQLEAAGIEYLINPLNKKLTEIELAKMVTDFDIIIAGTEPITDYVMEKASKLKMISRVGIGLDSVDLLAAKRRGIEVSYTPDAPAPAVAVGSAPPRQAAAGSSAAAAGDAPHGVPELPSELAHGQTTPAQLPGVASQPTAVSSFGVVEGQGGKAPPLDPLGEGSKKQHDDRPEWDGKTPPVDGDWKNVGRGIGVGAQNDAV